MCFGANDCTLCVHVLPYVPLGISREVSVCASSDVTRGCVCVCVPMLSNRPNLCTYIQDGINEDDKRADAGGHL